MKSRPGQSVTGDVVHDGTVVDADDGLPTIHHITGIEEEPRDQGDQGGMGTDGSHLQCEPEKATADRRPEDVEEDVLRLRLGGRPGEGVEHPDPDNLVTDDLADIDHAVRSLAITALTTSLLIVATVVVDGTDRQLAIGLAVYLSTFLVTLVLARRYGREDGDLPPGTVGDARFVLALAGTAAITVSTPPAVDIGFVFLKAAAGLCGLADSTRIAIVGLRRDLTFRESLRAIRRRHAQARRQAWARLTRPHQTRHPGETP